MKTDFTSRRKARTVLAFVLYLCIIMCALCVEFVSVTANPKTFAKEFTNSVYVENMRCDIARYTKDLCQASSVPDNFVDNLITYDNIYIRLKMLMYQMSLLQPGSFQVTHMTA